MNTGTSDPMQNAYFAAFYMSLGDALKLMEERQSAISVLPVVDSASSKLLGMIRLHDIYS